MEPNEQQKKLINNTEGIYLVDAGAGTGKTFTITRRYANILREKNVEPEDVLLVTFTENAAEEMKRKVIDLCKDYSPTEMDDAPIQTFHSLCKEIVDQRGFSAPKLLGIDESIPSSIDIMENEILEEQEFKKFFDRFVDDNPQYKNYYRILGEPEDLLYLIKKLASKGVFPDDEGWFKNSEGYLDGNLEKFKDIFKEINRPKNSGKKQSDLRSKLYDYDKKCYPSKAPEKKDIRGVRGSKSVSDGLAEEAFEEDRGHLKEFVLDVYSSYIRYCLGQNYLNFSFLLMFAFIVVHEREEVREMFSFDYLMIDEFQDTSEIQFKLSLLLADCENICAVGDWKQSIYSFQYADVKNIKDFEERIEKYKKELNSGSRRVNFSVENVEKLPLKKNYRSTQRILDFSEQSLKLRAKNDEILDFDKIEENITSLESAKGHEDPSEIKAFKSGEEKEMILEKIQEIVGNSEYKIRGDDEWKTPDYSDIVILVRRSKFGLKLQKEAREFGIPLVYEGGTEVFRRPSAKLLLAWLRLLDYKDSRRGWSVVLERAGYTLDEIDYILENEDYPGNFLEFLEKLDNLQSISSVAKQVFDQYGIDNAFADKVLNILQSAFNSSYMNLGRIIQFIEDNIERGRSYEVDNNPKENVVKVRTIHAEKGLEHPIVFISDNNRSRFPSTTTNSSAISYRDPIGLRQKKIFLEDNYPYIYDNWKMEVLSKCLTGDYDEERRLMYVAMTRAKRFLFLTADEERASKFFQDLSIESETIEPDLGLVESESLESEDFEITKEFSSTPQKLSVHSIMGEVSGNGRGKEFGKKVHIFAEKYASGQEVRPESSDEKNIKEFIDSMSGDMRLEVDCFLPVETDNRKITLEGSIDLVNVEDNYVELVDYKTDQDRTNHSEYKKQLSVYFHVLDNYFSEKNVRASIFYTFEGESVPVEPLSIDELRSEAELFLDG